MADLCTLSDVKALAGKSTSANDGAYALLIASASEYIRTFTDRDFAAKTYSEIRDGNGGTELFLRNGPATAVTSLTIGGVSIPAQTVDQGPGYFLDDIGDLLCLFGFRYDRGRKNVRASYAAGAAAAPAPIAQACIEIVIAGFERCGRDPALVEKSLGPDGSQTFRWSQSDIPAAAKAVLLRYQRVTPA